CGPMAAVGGRVDVLEWLYGGDQVPEDIHISLGEHAFYAPITEAPDTKRGCEATLSWLAQKGALRASLMAPMAHTIFSSRPEALQILDKIVKRTSDVSLDASLSALQGAWSSAPLSVPLP